MGLWEVIRSCRGALTNEISALMKHLVSCGKHSELELLHGYTRGTPDPAPDLYPWLLLICILSNSLPAAKKGSLFTYPSQGTGLTWADRSQGRGPVWGGLSTQELCTKRSLQSTPSPLPGQSWPRARQSRIWTNKQLLLDRSVTLGFMRSSLPPPGLPEASTAPGPWAPVSTHHPSSS